MLRAGLALAFLAAMVSASTSCLTPTLPIPPPIIEALEGPDPTTGLVEVRVLAVNAEPDAEYLYVLNQRSGRGYSDGPEAGTGDFVVYVPAVRDDCLIVYWMYQVYELSQGTTCQTVP
jgi:hypothetical protein